MLIGIAFSASDYGHKVLRGPGKSYLGKDVSGFCDCFHFLLLLVLAVYPRAV